MLALSCAATGAAASNAVGQPWLAGGLNYYNVDARNLTEDNGLYVGFGYLDTGGTGAAGNASVDIELRSSNGKGNRLDSLGFTYAERIQVGEGFYAGFGIGSFYNRVKIGSDDVNDRKWSPGLKLIAGFDVRPNVYLESSWFAYSGKVGGKDTSGLIFAAGLRF